MAPSTVLSTKQQSLLRSTSLVSIMTFLSRLMGFARDMIIAQLFGASAFMDAFFVAFRIPNFMRRLFAEGAFSQAFVPVLAEYHQRPLIDVRQFIARVAAQLAITLSCVTLAGIIFSPIIIFIFAPGFTHDGTRAILATQMLKITIPYLMFISLTAMAGAVLNTYGYFGVPAITPIFLNLSMITAAWYLSPHCTPSVLSLAYGVLIAGVVQLLFQLPFLKKRQLLVMPNYVKHDPAVRRVMKLMVPALFGVSIAQLNLMVDSMFASFLPIGSVSWLYFTDRLTDFPLGIFGVAIATVILPHLSKQYANQSDHHFTLAIDWGLKSLLLVGLPAAVGLAFFAMPLITCCFAYGKFATFDVLQTQKSVIALASGVPAFMMVKVLASAFYARQDIKTPVKIGAFSMIFNSILCAIFVWPLAHAGLALASSLASYFNCGLLLRLLIKQKIYRPKPGWGKFLLQLAIANSLLACYLFFNTGNVDSWLLPPKWRILVLLFHTLLAAMIYFVSLRVLGLRWTHFRDLVK